MPFRAANFFSRFVAEFLSAQLENGTVRVDEYNDLIGNLQSNPKYLSAVDRLFRRSPKKVNVPGYGPLRIVYLHELTGRRFPFLQGLGRRPSGAKKLTCFVGHRFVAEITSKLRHNLAQLLGPHDIQLKGVARRSPSSFIPHPSSLITPSRPGGAELPETGSVPSDLQSLLRIPYATYEDLFKKLYFGLPMFFERNRLERGA